MEDLNFLKAYTETAVKSQSVSQLIFPPSSGYGRAASVVNKCEDRADSISLIECSIFIDAELMNTMT